MTEAAMNDNSLKFLHIGDGATRRGIAVRAQAGAAPGLFWLGGYKSDMKGTKAEALADWAAQAGRACGSTIPATASPKARSPTVLSVAGSPIVSSCSRPAVRGRKS